MASGGTVTTVSPHGLICLDDSDYAAIPLMLQVNKTTINSLLAAQATALTNYNLPELAFSQTTATQGPFAANSGSTLSDGTAVNLITSVGSQFPKGWYSMTATATFQEVGAVTLGSYRRLGCWAAYSNDFSDLTSMFDTVTIATNSGQPDSLNTTGWFYSDGVQNRSCILTFGHGNAGSSLNLLSGARITVEFLGTGVTL
jgi:hypothetical protein